MLIYRNYLKYNYIFKKRIIILLMLCCIITSCSNTDDFQKKNIFLHKNNICQLKKLIIPKGIHFPKQNKNYDFPYTQEELSKKKLSIFPPE